MSKTIRDLALSLTIGTLSALTILPSCVAAAQEAVPQPFVPPTPGEYVMGGGLAILLIGACVRALREVFTDTLAPVPSTKLSRGLVLLLSVVAGVLWGLIGVGVPIIAGKVGYAVGGAGLGLLTYIGAKVVPEKARLDTIGRVGAQTDTSAP